jgi:hypothetical protein
MEQSESGKLNDEHGWISAPTPLTSEMDYHFRTQQDPRLPPSLVHHNWSSQLPPISHSAMPAFAPPLFPDHSYAHDDYASDYKQQPSPNSPSGSSSPSSPGGLGAVPRLPPILQVEKQVVTTSATQAASASRRTNAASFQCPVPSCTSTFTRRFNLRGALPPPFFSYSLSFLLLLTVTPRLLQINCGHMSSFRGVYIYPNLTLFSAFSF